MGRDDPAADEKELTVLIQLIANVILAALLVGVLYTSGIVNGSRWIGIGLLASGVASFYPLLRLTAMRTRGRDRSQG